MSDDTHSGASVRDELITQLLLRDASMAITPWAPTTELHPDYGMVIERPAGVRICAAVRELGTALPIVYPYEIRVYRDGVAASLSRFRRWPIDWEPILLAIDRLLAAEFAAVAMATDIKSVMAKHKRLLTALHERFGASNVLTTLSGAPLQLTITVRVYAKTMETMRRWWGWCSETERATVSKMEWHAELPLTPDRARKLLHDFREK